MPNTNEINAATLVPLPGRGVAISIIRSIAPYLLNLFVCSFLVLLNSFSKNLSMDSDLSRKNLEIGLIRASIIAPGRIAPGTANRKIVVVESPKPIPTGIASLSSRKGAIAVKKTISSDAMGLI